MCIIRFTRSDREGFSCDRPGGAFKGFVLISISCPGFLEPVRQLLTVLAFSWADTTRKRIAKPITATTANPPPIAAPINEPVETEAGGETAGPPAIPANGFTECVGEAESVGPGVSVGVTEGEAPIRSVGVGEGVSVGVTDEVTDPVGVGE